MVTGCEPVLYGGDNDYCLMAIIVEDYVGGRKISYDLVKFHRVLSETLVKKGVLTSEEIESLYKKSK